MNGLGRKNDQKEQKKSILTRETMGVVIILFATLSLVCLITRDAIFSEPGRWINYFFLGSFGVFAYAVLLYLVIVGVVLITGKKTGLTLKKKVLLTVSFCLLAILTHSITMRNYSSLNFSSYVATSFKVAESGISTSSAGGLFAGILTYVFPALLTNVGCYVVVGIGLAVSVYFTGKEIFFNKKQPTEKKKKGFFKGAFVKKKKGEELTIDGITIVGEKEYPIDDVVPEKVQAKAKLFINNPNDFATRNKREIAKEKGDYSIKLEFAENGLGVVSSSTPKATVQPPISQEFKSKLDYIKTPAAINVEKISSQTFEDTYSFTSKNEQTNVSDYVQERESEVKEQEETVIPHLEHDEPAKEGTAENSALNFQRYADFTDDGMSDITTFEAKETFRTVPEQEPIVEQEESTFEIPMIEEQTEEIVEEVKDTFEPIVEEKVEPIEKVEDVPPVKKPDIPVVEEKPAESIISTRRMRNLFGDNVEPKPEIVESTEEQVKPQDNAFTSRVSADNNLSSSRRMTGFGFDSAVQPTEPVVEEEKPKKPAPPINRKYYRPPLDLLETYSLPLNADKDNHEERMEIIQKTLEEFHIGAIPQSYVKGPSITRYEIMMPAGISVKKVLAYDDDLKMRLAVRDGVRIEAPIPGKNLVGIEVANSVKVTVGLKEVMEALASKQSKPTSLMFALGKDIVGNAISDDLTKGPHYLVAGATGSGKSVALHTMIISLLMRYSPEELKLVLVDPKSVEFRKYEHIPHLLVDEIITEPKRALALLQWAYDETNRRNEMFTECGGMISNIEDYNTQIANDTIPKLPRIVFIIDELADLMEACRKDLEEKIRRIAAKSRSAGIHLVLATQRPSVDVITGTIKANLPSRIALKVMNYADSSTILGGGGAEKLLGNGDMLYKNSSMGDYERYQGAYISGKEVANIVNYIKEKNKAYFDDEVQEYLDNETKAKVEPTPSGADADDGNSNEPSELFLQALWLAVNSQSASISQFQRRFGIGYNRAGGLIDKMEMMGFVSANEGSKARRVFLTKEEYTERFGTPPESYF
ncbi:MAG: hypothetical protein IJC07_04800 [Clostridia bacterium]|nr:hypothetical protein [Clostridia bacterium]